jgi:hypothetical protein
MKMNKVLIALVGGLLVLTMAACEIAGITVDLGGNGAGSPAASIEAGIDSPANNATLPLAPVEIAYHASSAEGVAAVELSIDNTVVISINSPASDQKVVALKYTWNPITAGTHTIRVRAQASGGLWSDYYGVMVTIPEAQMPDQQQPGSQQPAEPQPEAPTPTVKPEPTATPDVLTIYDVEHSKNIFYYGGGGCNREITITAKVTQPEDVYAMILFIRFWDKEGAGLTKWDSGRAMSKKSSDTYSVTLFSEKIPNYNAYEFAVMYYQIKVQDKNGNILAGTDVFKEVTLQICQ